MKTFKMSRFHSHLLRFFSHQNDFSIRGLTKCRWHSTRTLSVTSPALTKSEKPPADEKDDPNKPIKFSTSPANHRTWTVARSMGSDHQRSLWKVLPFSVCCLSILLWCVLREETDDDQILENGHHEHSTENHEEQHVKEKPS